MESTLNKVTPGSWKAARVFGNNVPDSFKVFTKTFGGVCVADCGDNEENAKLCAAAPALLEALSNILEHRDRMLLGDDHVYTAARNLLEKINKKD